MKMMRDHPILENMESTGYPDGKEPTYPRCPICGEKPLSERSNLHD